MKINELKKHPNWIPLINAWKLQTLSKKSPLFSYSYCLSDWVHNKYSQPHKKFTLFIFYFKQRKRKKSGLDSFEKQIEARMNKYKWYSQGKKKGWELLFYLLFRCAKSFWRDCVELYIKKLELRYFNQFSIGVPLSSGSSWMSRT